MTSHYPRQQSKHLLAPPSVRTMSMDRSPPPPAREASASQKFLLIGNHSGAFGKSAAQIAITSQDTQRSIQMTNRCRRDEIIGPLRCESATLLEHPVA